MLKTTRILVMAGVMAAAGSEARAQTQPPPATLGFLNVTFATQPSSRTVGRSQSFPVYGETATADDDPRCRRWRRVRHHCGLSVRTGPVWAEPWRRRWLLELQQYFGQRSRRHHPQSAGLRSAANDQRERQRSGAQRTRHPSAGGVVRADHESDRRRACRPARRSSSSARISSRRSAIPPGTQNANPVVETEKKTAIGLNIGVDGSYLFTRNVGAGIFLRYAGAEADLPSAPDLRVGGFQFGVGARVRF